jgi:hypothetical protein
MGANRSSFILAHTIISLRSRISSIPKSGRSPVVLFYGGSTSQGLRSISLGTAPSARRPTSRLRHFREGALNRLDGRAVYAATVLLLKAEGRAPNLAPH